MCRKSVYNLNLYSSPSFPESPSLIDLDTQQNADTLFAKGGASSSNLCQDSSITAVIKHITSIYVDKKLKKMGIEGPKHITSTNISKTSSIDTKYRAQKPNLADFRLEQINDIYLAEN
jgi:hypothetical protein